MGKQMITLKKAGDFVPPRAWLRVPGAGSMVAQRQAQALSAEDQEVLALYTHMPEVKLHPDGHFMVPYDVVKGLGLDPTDEAIWTHRVGSIVAKAPDELALRKSLVPLMKDEGLAPDVRNELARRVFVFFKSKHPKGLIEKGMPPPGGPQPKRRPAPAPQAPVQTGKPKAMEMSKPGKAPPSLADQQPGGDPTADPQVDMAGIDEEVQDPKLLKTKLMRLADQLSTLHGDIAGSPGHIHMHNEIKELLRSLMKAPTPEGVREAEHQVAHFSALCQGAPDVAPNAVDPNDPNAQQPGQPGQPGQAGGPAFRGPKDKPGKPIQKGLTLAKAFGEAPKPAGGGASTALSRPKPAGVASTGAHGEGSRGGHIVGHGPSGKPIYAQQHVTSAMQPGEAPEDAQARLRQHMLDAVKALHEHEQAHGLQSTFNSGAPGQKQVGGQAPGWTSPTADTVIRGQSAPKPAPIAGKPPAAPAVGGSPAPAALPPSSAPGGAQAGPGGTNPGRRMTNPKQRGQAAPAGPATSGTQELAHGDIEDSKKIANAVAKDGYVGKTSTGKDVSIGTDTSKFTPQELGEAANLHRAAQSHLLASAKATNNPAHREAARKHLNEEFKLSSQFVSHPQHGEDPGEVFAPMKKAMDEWKPLAAWGHTMLFLRAQPRRLDRQAPKLTLVKADKKGIKLTEAMESALEINVLDDAHDDDADRVKLRSMIQNGYFYPPEDEKERKDAAWTLNEIAEGEENDAEHKLGQKFRRFGADPEGGKLARAAGKALRSLEAKVNAHGQPQAPKAPRAPSGTGPKAKKAADALSEAAGIAGREAWRASADAGSPQSDKRAAEMHAEAARLTLDAANAHHAVGNVDTAEYVEKTAQKHMAEAGPVYVGPRGGRWRNAAHTESAKKGGQLLTLRKASDAMTGLSIPDKAPKPAGVTKFRSGPRGEGSRGGHVIGHTKSGKAIYESASGPLHAHFTPGEHEEAAQLHGELGQQGDAALHRMQARTHRHMASAKAASAPATTPAGKGPIGINEHERVFNTKGATVIPHTAIQQDRPSPDDAVERSAKYMEAAQSGKGKKRDPLEVWKVNHKEGGFHYALRDGNTTYQMLRKRGWTHFPVNVTKTVNEKDYTPVGEHVAAGGGHAEHTDEKTPEEKSKKRKEQLEKLKRSVEHLKLMHQPTPAVDEHGQQVGETAPQLKGGLNHHVKIAKDFLAKHAASLDDEVAKLKGLAPKGAKVKGRVKDLPSTIGKLTRKPKYGDASKMQDGTGLRIVTDSIQNVKGTVDKIKKNYKVIDEDNYIDKPNGHGTDNDFGYRSHHLIVQTPDGLQKEIQVRTKGQDAHADWSHDAYSPVTDAQAAAVKAHGPAIKEYARKAGEYLFKKESGQDPGPAPKAHPEVEAAFGKLHLDQGDSKAH